MARFVLTNNGHEHFKWVISDGENENDDNEIAWMQNKKDAALIHRALLIYENFICDVARKIKNGWENGDDPVLAVWKTETVGLTPEEKEKVWRKLFPDAAQ